MPNNIQTTTNYKKAVEVSRKALEMKRKKIYPFSLEDLFPDATVPNGIEPGSLKHAHYLFYSVVLDRGRESIDVYRRCRAMWQLLDFSELPNQNPSYIKWFLHENFAKPKEEKGVYANPVRTWTENSRKLEQIWENNPIKLKANTVKQTIKNISTFRGFKEQMSKLLIKNMVKAGIWDFPLNEFSIKIDRHVIRISYGTGVIEVKGTNEIRYDVLVPYLSKVYEKVTKEKEISPIDLNDAFWAIGKYKCGKKNALYCLGNCDIRCETKVLTDKQFTVLKLNQDTRRNVKNLFSK